MYDEWTVELKAMADRIISMREQLFVALSARGFLLIPLSLIFYSLVLVLAFKILSKDISISYLTGTPGDWSHIIKQIGMFTLSQG